MYKNRLIILYFCLINTALQAQIKVLPGTSIIIHTGTTLRFNSSTSDSLITDTLTQILNNGAIFLDTTTIVSEFKGFPITGSGYETVSKNVTIIGSTANVNGLGLNLNAASFTSPIILKRWHVATTNQMGDNSVKRVFHLNCTNVSDTYSVSFEYDSTEQNGLDSSLMLIYNSTDSVLWSNLGGYPLNHSVTGAENSSGNNYFTLFNASLTSPYFSDSVYCSNDSLIVPFTITGLFNTNSQFILQYSMDTGFSPLTNFDTLTSSGNFEGILPLGSALGDTIYLRIISVNPTLNNIQAGNVIVYSYPVVSLTGLANAYCSNNTPAILTTSPAGGILTGSGIIGTTFAPDIAGPGSHIVTYTVSYSSCASVVSDTTMVNAAPAVTLNSPQTIFCLGGPAINLAGSPLGGTFSGFGLTSSVFSPVNSGTDTVFYTYTDSLGCVSYDSLMFTVNTLPVVMAGNDTALCDNTPSFTFISSPAGGYWNGTGITDTLTGEYNTSLAGTGTFSIAYIYTDGLTGCVNSDTLVASINSSPANPVITATGATLTSSVSGVSYQWYLDGSPISGSNSVSITAAVNGVYTVNVTNASGCTSTGMLNFTGSDINESAQNYVRVYPNPVKQGGILHVTSTQDMLYELTGIDGKKIAKGKTQQNAIDIHFLPNGAYMLFLTDDTGTLYTYKIIVA
ncbi:MAG TPA: T9SS type A sorting domain-containing protein [Flavobacteriales bacterium]|nr:T9SS type A sorting domain-containing protein [Flavobacteriales bacterium]